MRIKVININSFMGFQNKEIYLNGNMNIIVSCNNAQTTALLKAIKIGLGAYLQSLPQLPAGTPYRMNYSYHDAMEEHNGLINTKGKPRISITADFPITSFFENENAIISYIPVMWYRELVNKRTTHTKACAGELMDLVYSMVCRRNEERKGTVYPLVLSCGTKQTDNQEVRKTGKTMERASRIEKAYKFALHNKVNYIGAMEWLNHYDKDIKDKKEFEGTREAFFEALQIAIPSLSKVDYDNGEIEATVTLTGRKSERLHFPNMSDDLQAMIKMVSEIAHRCILLNGCLGRNAVRQTPGIVLIDEIDLYLHSLWQEHVLINLTRAFPQIQFIVSVYNSFTLQDFNEEWHVVNIE